MNRGSTRFPALASKRIRSALVMNPFRGSYHCEWDTIGWPAVTLNKRMSNGISGNQGFLVLAGNILRETVPSQTSDMGEKTLSVLAHIFLLP